MATRLSPADEAPFNIQIKNLADEEDRKTSGKKPSRSRAPCVPNISKRWFLFRITSVLSCWSCSCVPASARSPAEPDHLLNTSVSARPAPERPNGIGTLPLLREGFWRPCP